MKTATFLISVVDLNKPNGLVEKLIDVIGEEPGNIFSSSLVKLNDTTLAVNMMYKV